MKQDDELTLITVGTLRVLEAYAEKAIIARDEFEKPEQTIKLGKAIQEARKAINS